MEMILRKDRKLITDFMLGRITLEQGSTSSNEANRAKQMIFTVERVFLSLGTARKAKGVVIVYLKRTLPPASSRCSQPGYGQQFSM